MKKINLLRSLMVCSFATTPLLSVISCGKNETTVDVAEESIKEFKALSAYPRPSGSMNEIRSYLINWAKQHGFESMVDNYGNMWFDVPASKGCENYPKVILQGHMDIVFNYDEAQASEKGIPDPKTYSPIAEDEVVNGQRIIHGKDYFTNLGADDGYGIGLALAIVANKNIKHGSIRCLFTADEEVGLKGASNLSQKAIDSDYLISLDGEGSEAHPYTISSGSQGFNDYYMAHSFEGSDEASLNCIKITVKGLSGHHFTNEPEIRFDKEKGAMLNANADAMILDVIQSLDDNSFRLATFEHKDDQGVDKQWEPRYLPQFAQAVIYTQKTAEQIQGIIDGTLRPQWIDSFRLEKWSTVDVNVSDESNKPKALSHEDSNTLLNMFNSDSAMKYFVGEWEGKTDVEKAEKNYPQAATNISTFTLKHGTESILNFRVGVRDCSSLHDTILELREKSKGTWIHKFDTEGLTINKEYLPWDASNTFEYIQDSIDAFKHFGVEPQVEKTRGGLEPTYFCVARPGLKVTCLGPRVENIHTYNETLYADTIPILTNVVLYLLENMNKYID